MLSYSLSGGLEGLGTGGALSLQQAGGETHWLSEIPVSYTSYNSTCQLKAVPVGFQQARFASLLLFECVVKRATELCLLLLPRGGQELPPPVPGGIKAGAQPPWSGWASNCVLFSSKYLPSLALSAVVRKPRSPSKGSVCRTTRSGC